MEKNKIQLSIIEKIVYSFILLGVLAITLLGGYNTLFPEKIKDPLISGEFVSLPHPDEEVRKELQECREVSNDDDLCAVNLAITKTVKGAGRGATEETAKSECVKNVEEKFAAQVEESCISPKPQCRFIDKEYPGELPAITVTDTSQSEESGVITVNCQREKSMVYCKYCRRKKPAEA